MDDMVCNTEIAIMTTINELAGRFGIKPYHFCAALTQEEDGCRLAFLDFAEEVPHKQVGNFVELVTGDKELYVLNDDDGIVHMLQGLCRSLAVAPTSRSKS